MQQERRKSTFGRWELVCVIILVPVMYTAVVVSIYGKEYNLPWRMISEGLSVMLVLGSDTVWILLMTFCRLKSTRANVLLTLLLFTLSAVILTDLYLIHTWHKMW